jgi:hypothetical protein
MAKQIEEVQTRFSGPAAESIADRDERLRRAGVSMPTLRDMAPYRPVRRRPRWLAFLLRFLSIAD